MIHVVGDETIKLSSLCTSGFQCLEGDLYPQCEVDGSVDDDPLYVICSRPQQCGFMFELDSPICICTCPTRREIHDRYER